MWFMHYPVTYREERDKEHAAQLARKIKEVIDDNLIVYLRINYPLTMIGNPTGHCKCL